MEAPRQMEAEPEVAKEPAEPVKAPSFAAWLVAVWPPRGFRPTRSPRGSPLALLTRSPCGFQPRELLAAAAAAAAHPPGARWGPARTAVLVAPRMGGTPHAGSHAQGRVVLACVGRSGRPRVLVCAVMGRGRRPRRNGPERREVGLGGSRLGSAVPTAIKRTTRGGGFSLGCPCIGDAPPLSPGTWSTTRSWPKASSR